MATQQSLNTVQSLYVAYYGRPADPSGLQYWAERLEASGGNLSDIINAFGNSAEYAANIGNLGISAQVNNLYQQLFGRDAEEAGLDYYTNLLSSGEKTLAEIALTIREAAQGSDRTTFEGRTAVANAFTQELNTPEKIAAYSTDRGIGIGRDYLKRVNEQTSAEDVLNDAAPVADTLIPETEPETPPTGGGGNPSPLTFTATLDHGAVVFGGTATGPITLEADADTNEWTFTRNGIEQTVGGDDVTGITQGTATLTGDAQLFDNLTVTGTGQLTLNDFTSDLNLDGLAKTLTVKAIVATDQDISLNTHLSHIDSYTVNSNATLTLTAAQADGVTITGESVELSKITLFAMYKGGSVEVLLDGDAAYDLSKITAGAASSTNAEDAGTLIATLAATATLNEDTDLGDFTLELSGTTDVELTLTAAQATERDITGDDGDSVIVEGLAADTDLSGIDSDIDVTANVAQSIDISSNENLESVDTFVVENNAVFTLSARQADEQVVETEDNGTVVVSGSPEFIVDGDNNIDLTSLPALFTFEGGSLVVPAGVTITLTAAQANGKVITGAGNVVVEDLGDAQVDLSSITVTGSKIAKVEDESDNAVVLHAATKLGGFTLDVQDQNTLTMTAVQANALTTLTGEGSAIINDTLAGESLDFIGKDQWDIDTLTINGLNGVDILRAPAGVENVTLNGGLAADTFVVDERNEGTNPIQLGDFNMTVDVLDINKGGIAAIDLTDPDVTKLISNDVISFTAVEDDDRLSNEGTLIIQGIGNGDNVAGSRGQDIFVIKEAGARLTNYAEADVIDLSQLKGFNASIMEVRASNDSTTSNPQIAVEFDGKQESLLLDGALDRTITFTGANFITINDTQNDTIKVNIAGDIDQSSATDDVNLIGGDANQTLTGGEGNDFLYGGAGKNALYGGAGDDKLYATTANTLYDGGEGDDSIVVYEIADISGATVTSVESLKIYSDANGGFLSVTISEDQLAAFVDQDGESTIEKGDNDLVILNADAGINADNTIELAGSDGILQAISNLHSGDTIDFSGLVGVTTFLAATDNDSTDQLIGTVDHDHGDGNDINIVDGAGEWQLATNTGVLTYWDGSKAVEITLAGISSVTADGTAELSINLIS